MPTPQPPVPTPRTDRNRPSALRPVLPVIGGGATIVSLLAGAPLSVGLSLCAVSAVMSAALLWRGAGPGAADAALPSPQPQPAAPPQAHPETREPDERTLHRERNAAIDRLIGIVVEDIDRQRNTIAGSLRSLESQMGEAPGASQKLGQIRMALDRMGAFKSRLLTLGDQTAWQPERINSVIMIETAANLAKDSLLSEATFLKLDSTDALWPVEADPDQMLSALLHLTVNARDAMPRSGTVTIAAHNVSLMDAPSGLRGDHLAISVADTGAGIAAEHLSQVFLPFFSTKTPHGGAGLGLTQVKTMALRAGGNVDISSTPGAGTTVTLYLPRAAARPVSPAQHGDTPTATLDILIAKGDEAEAAALADIVRAAGYSARTATRALDACAIVRKARPRLVITDAAMRGIIDSISLGRYLRHTHPKLRIVLTGPVSGGADAGILPILPDTPTVGALADLLGKPADCDGTSRSRPAGKIAIPAE